MLALEKLQNFLRRRQTAYRAVFNDGVQAERVLKDLARFCRAQDSAFHADPRLHAVLEGRREVFLRIQKHLKLDWDQFWKHYGKVDTNE